MTVQQFNFKDLWPELRCGLCEHHLKCQNNHQHDCGHPGKEERRRSSPFGNRLIHGQHAATWLFYKFARVTEGQNSLSARFKVQITFFSSCSISPALMTMGPRTAYSIFLTWGLMLSSDSTFHRLHATNWVPDEPCSSFRAAFEATLSTTRNMFHSTTQMEVIGSSCSTVSPSHECYFLQTTREDYPKQSTSPP